MPSTPIAAMSSTLSVTPSSWAMQLLNSLTLRGHVLHFNSQLVSHEADDAEYHEAGEEAGQTVAARYDQRVSGGNTT